MLKTKILHLLKGMGGMCLDSEEERGEVATRLASALCSTDIIELEDNLDEGYGLVGLESNMDELIDELVDSDPLKWEYVNGERSLTVNDVNILLRNFNNHSTLELFVCDQLMILDPRQRMELFKMCHKFRACDQHRVIAKAVHELRRKFREV